MRLPTPVLPSFLFLLEPCGMSHQTLASGTRHLLGWLFHKWLWVGGDGWILLRRDFPCGNMQHDGARLRSPFLRAASLKLSKEGGSFLSCQRPSLYGLGQLPPAEAVRGLEWNERSWRRGGSLERNTTCMLLLFCSSVPESSPSLW